MRESEKLSEKSRQQAAMDPDEAPLPAAERLRTAVRILHLRAGRPAPGDIAVTSRRLLTTSDAASILETTVLQPHDVLETYVRVPGDDINHFGRGWCYELERADVFRVVATIRHDTVVVRQVLGRPLQDLIVGLPRQKRNRWSCGEGSRGLRI